MNRTRLLLRPFLGRLLLTGTLAATLAQPATSQELPWLNRGQVRLDFAPGFWSWDSRYGTTADGSSRVESLGLDLTANPLGSQTLPDLRELEASLAQALGDDSYRVQLGVSQAYIDQSRLTFPFRLEVGITDWLSVGAMVPLVRPRTEITFAFDADSMSANSGRSPRATNAAAVSQFLNSFQTVLTSAAETSPGNPLVAEAQAYLDALTQAYGYETFFPVAGSAAGNGLQARLDELRGLLNDAGFTGVPGTVPLAEGLLDQAGFQEFLSGPQMQAARLEDWTTPWAIGDLEVSAAARLIHRGFEPDSLGNMDPVRFQLGGGLLVRLGTAQQADYNRFFDQSTGDGQTDVEGSVFGLLQLGNRFGAWGRVRYGLQMEGELFRRIAGPDEALPDRGRLAPLDWTPGNYFEVDLNPRLFLTSATSFGIRYHLWSKGADEYKLQPLDPDVLERLNLPPAELLEGETEMTLQELGVTAVFSTVEAYARGEASMPIHLRATFFTPIGGSGGQTPKGGRAEVGLTVYRSIWGGSSASSGTNQPGAR